MFETHLTVVGKLVTGVEQRRFADGSVVANFRIMSTQRRYDRAAGSWTDGDRLFLDVSCWRRLAENTFGSLVKGDHVVVTGRLYTREWEQEGRRRSTVALEAQNVGADLAWCTAALTRTGTPAATESDGRDHAVREPAGAEPGLAGDAPAPHDDDAARLVGATPGGEG